MNDHRGYLRNQRGLTLIEFMMASLLASIVFMVLYTILNATLEGYSVGQIRSAAAQNSRVTMMRIANELKYADEIFANNDSLIIFSRKEETSGAFQTVDIQFLSGPGHITREENYGGAEVIAEGIDTFTLTYWNAAFGPATSVDAVRFIVVNMRLQERGYTVYLRNMVTLENPIKVQ